MDTTITEISTSGLAVAFVPAIAAIAIMFRWAASAGTAIYATVRMLIQLLLIGYVLVYIFQADQWWIIAVVLLVMLFAASLIAIRPLARREPKVWLHALSAIAVSSVLTLCLVTQGVLGVEPWYSPRYVVPLAGMIIAGAMNAVSLAAERYAAELSKGEEQQVARTTALQAALIPIINSLFAVGLVSLPGMMTGQILSGTSPLIAAKYQIVVMTMLFGASGIGAAVYLSLAQRAGRLDPVGSAQ